MEYLICRGKVKKLILTHYILFIWKDRCMFFSDAAFPSRMLFPLFPMDLPGSSISATAQPLATEPRPAVSLPLRRPWPAASSRWLSALALPPAVASRCCRIAPRGASPAGRQPLPHRFPLQRPCRQHLPDGSSLQRPCQQQTSSGGEKYSGLASNLAHLGRIC